MQSLLALPHGHASAVHCVINHGVTFSSLIKIMICTPAYFLMSSSQPTLLQTQRRGWEKRSKDTTWAPEQERPVQTLLELGQPSSWDCMNQRSNCCLYEGVLGGGEKGRRMFPFLQVWKMLSVPQKEPFPLLRNGLGLSLTAKLLFNLGVLTFAKPPSLSFPLSLETDAVHFHAMVSSSLISLPTSQDYERVVRATSEKTVMHLGYKHGFGIGLC